MSFSTEEEGFREAFSLKENEYLCRRLRGIPAPVIRDLSVGQLRRVLVEARNRKEKVAR